MELVYIPIERRSKRITRLLRDHPPVSFDSVASPLKSSDDENSLARIPPPCVQITKSIRIDHPGIREGEEEDLISSIEFCSNFLSLDNLRIHSRLLINKLYFFSFSYHRHLKLLYFALLLLIKPFQTRNATQILEIPDSKFPTCFFLLTQDRSISLSLRLRISLSKDERITYVQ